MGLDESGFQALRARGLVMSHGLMHWANFRFILSFFFCDRTEFLFHSVASKGIRINQNEYEILLMHFSWMFISFAIEQKGMDLCLLYV